MIHAIPSRPLRLRRRPDLVVQPLHYGSRRYWGIKDPVSLRYFQLRDEEYRILQMLDGRSSAEAIRERFEREFAPRRLSLHQLQSFLGMLHNEGLILAEATGQAGPLLERSRRRRRQELFRAFTNVLAIRFRGFDPEPLLARLYPACRWMFSPAFLIGCLLLALSALLLAAVHFDKVQARLPDFAAFFEARNLLLLAGTVAACKVLHELGHALACRHFGGECHEVGLMFLVFTPCLYCNVSDAWMFPNKWRRIAVGAAGMVVELVLASLAAFVWWFSEPGLLNALALNTMVVCSVSTLLFNGNPLLRYDGYYILADLVETPNLGQQSAAVVRTGLARWFLGTEGENERVLPDRGHGWLAAYAVASFLYRWFVVLAILWFCHHVLKQYRLEVLAQVLAVTVVAGLLSGPLWRAVTLLQDPVRSREMNWSRLIVRGGAAAALVVGCALLPLPHRVPAPAVLEAEGARRVYVAVPGRLVESMRAGDRVEAGQVLGRLENLELRREIEQLRGRRNQQQILLANLERRRVSDPDAGAQIPTAREALADLEERLRQRQLDEQRLTLAAPADGTVLPPPARRASPRAGNGRELAEWSATPLEERNQGCFLRTGTLFCQIGDPQRLEAVLVIDQSDVEHVRIGQRVKLQLDELPGDVLGGTIVEVAEIDLKVAPRMLVRHEDLPTRPDERGAPRLLSTAYQARVALDPHERSFLVGSAGRARIIAEPQSLAARLARYLGRTFRIEL